MKRTIAIPLLTTAALFGFLTRLPAGADRIHYSGSILTMAGPMLQA